MSWSIYNKAVSPLQYNALTEEELATCEAQNPGCRDAVLKAWATALDLAASGQWGSDQKGFTINLSGHHNPDCEPVAGMGNDMVSMTVIQR